MQFNQTNNNVGGKVINKNDNVDLIKKMNELGTRMANVLYYHDVAIPLTQEWNEVQEEIRRRCIAE